MLRDAGVDQPAVVARDAHNAAVCGTAPSDSSCNDWRLGGGGDYRDGAVAVPRFGCNRNDPDVEFRYGRVDRGTWEHAGSTNVLVGDAELPPLKWSDLRYVFDIKEDCARTDGIGDAREPGPTMPLSSPFM